MAPYMMADVVLVALVASVALSVNASTHSNDIGPFRFAQAYKDHAVLQRAPASASVWGWGPAGAQVSVSIVDKAMQSVGAASATVDGGGHWRVSLPPQPASTSPVNITATLSTTNEVIMIGDILFGDVWVCSGQSNMAFSTGVPLVDNVAEAKIMSAYLHDPGASPFGTYINASTAINTADQYPDIRLMVVGNKHDCPAPIEDWGYDPTNRSALLVAQPWARASSTSVGSGADVMGGSRIGLGMSATCWYFGFELHQKLSVPIGLIHTSYGGSAVEDWISAPVLGDGKSGKCPGPIVGSMGQPSQQYNGQLRPLLNTTIKGAIWYQGESNHGQDSLYACRFQQMMKEWRSEWYTGTGGSTDPDFPIGFVQIGPMDSAPSEATNFQSYSIRMGQTADFGYAPNKCWPNTFMATGFDLANPPGTHCVAGCIHIFNKQAVAHRLAVGAMATVYNETGLVFSGPRVVSVAATTANAAVITYGGPGVEGKGIVLRGGFGFEVCYVGSNCTFASSTSNRQGLLLNGSNDSALLTPPASAWFAANVSAATSTTIAIHGPDSAGTINMIRYGFYDAPSIFTDNGPCVFNGEGIPATPGLYGVGSVPYPPCPPS